MKMKDAFVLVGCPLSSSFRADARVVGVLEAMRSKNEYGISKENWLFA